MWLSVAVYNKTHTQTGVARSCTYTAVRRQYNSNSSHTLTLCLLVVQISGSGAEGMSSIIVQGGEQYGLEHPRAEMDLLRHEIDISIDQKLKGVEKRLQVSTALAALKPQLLAGLHARFQGFDSRLQVWMAPAILSVHACMPCHRQSFPYTACCHPASRALDCASVKGFGSCLDVCKSFCLSMLSHVMVCNAMPVVYPAMLCSCYAMPRHFPHCPPNVQPQQVLEADHACVQASAHWEGIP